MVLLMSLLVPMILCGVRTQNYYLLNAKKQLERLKQHFRQVLELGHLFSLFVVADELVSSSTLRNHECYFTTVASLEVEGQRSHFCLYTLS